MKYTNVIIFDLDGTLLDSLLDLAESANAALKFCNLPEVSYEKIKNSIGDGVELLIRRIVPNDCSEEKIQECISSFKIYYESKSKVHTKPFDGIIPMLENLKRKGFKLGVVSNKPDKFVKNLCREFFEGLIDTAVGESVDIKIKPSPEGIYRVINELQAEPDKTVFAGDSEVDIMAAKNAGIYSIGVLWGYRSEKVLTEAGADSLADSPERLGLIL